MLEVRPISRSRNLLEWHQERALLDMNPSYQRRANLWGLKNKQLLINSVLNNYDIPKIYVADFTYSESGLNEDRKPYAVIDGKQRLTTFFAFFDNRLKLDSTPVFFEDQTVQLKGFYYSDLKKRYAQLAQRVERFTPTVMSVISDGLDEIQELFIRLNLNVSISGAERRNALPGPLPRLIRHLSTHEFFRKYASFPINRGQDLNLAAKVLLMEQAGGFSSTKKADLDHFVISAVKKPERNFENAMARSTENLNLMMRAFLARDPLLGSQTQIPVYYWLVRNYGVVGGMREGLNRFEEARKHARNVADARARGKDLPPADEELVRFNAILRSPDDKASQASMYETIKKFLGLR